MIRSGSADPPDDARSGRAGWSAGGRKRVTPPAPSWRAAPDQAQNQPQNPPSGPEQRPRAPHNGQPPVPPQQRPQPRPAPPWRSEQEWRSEPHRAEQHRAEQRSSEQPTQRARPYETYDPDGQPPNENPRNRNSGPQAAERTTANRFTGPPPRREHGPGPDAPPREPGSDPRVPKKITVTRVVGYRGRQIGQQAVNAFKRAAHADGAHESGLSALTYAVMINYASSATMAVGLANTLFFSAATAESRTKVALYLLITVAPFALIAPVIGPALDRVQRGRRLALAISCVGQGLLSVVMALHFNDWLLYPAALGTMVLSKSFDVLKAAVTPRVLPSSSTLSKTNARLTVFGLAAGAVFGAFGSGAAKLFGSPGALWFTAVLCIADAVLCLRIPAWVEVTEGEVPASLRAEPNKPKRQPMGRHVVVGLWGNGTIRLLTGFLMLFPAFVIKTLTEHSPGRQLVLLGLVGAAAGLGSFAGNAIGARLHFGKPDQVIVGCLSAALAGAVLAAIMPGIGTAAVAALIAATASGLAKISLDATIQNDLPEASRASAFGRSETILQLSWVFGGALGVLLPTNFLLGFAVTAALIAVGLAQTVLTRRGQTMIPKVFGTGRRPWRAAPVGEPRPSPAEAGTKPATRVMPTEHLNHPG
ncbi:MAG TPA: MFS transporter [Pseudonocardiaceae bacterium]|nr:MFS transporter [Pseudonocardiaceae bacterium]